MLTLLDELNKFLGYLNINPRYLNRAYTILSAIPIFFVIKSLIDMDKSTLTIAFIGYVLSILIIIYFWILNFMYYFLGRNTILDVTQLLARKLPDDMFNHEGLSSNNVKTLAPDTESLKIKYVHNYSIILQQNINELTKAGKIKTQDYLAKGGYLIPFNTLYPYYDVEKDLDNPDYYNVRIGIDWNKLETIGKVYTGNLPIKTLGLFITGGPFQSKGIKYKQLYGLKLVIKQRKREDYR